MDYETMRKEFEARFHAVTATPEVFYAFSNEQFAKHVQEARDAGITDKFCIGPCGMFGTERAMDELVRLTKEHRLELLEAMEDPAFAIPAFKREMWNHEYVYNWQGFEDVMECFNYELGPEVEHEDGSVTRKITHIVTGDVISPSVIESFNKARSEYYAECNEF